MNLDIGDIVQFRRYYWTDPAFSEDRRQRILKNYLAEGVVEEILGEEYPIKIRTIEENSTGNVLRIKREDIVKDPPPPRCIVNKLREEIKRREEGRDWVMNKYGVFVKRIKTDE